MSLTDESEDLTVHVNVCAERYRGIQEQFNQLDKTIDKLENKVDAVSKDVTEGNRSMRNIVIGSTITIVLSMMSVLYAIANGT